MKIIVAVVLALVAVACAVDEPIPIVRSEFQQQPEGPYEFGFETANGINRQETGELKQALDEDNKPHSVVVVRGYYSYPGEDGKPVSVSYSADENGYTAEGDSIPKLPSRR